MKRSYKVLSLLLTLALVIGLLPTVLPTVAEAKAPAGIHNNLPSTAKDIKYLSDMNWEYSFNYQGHEAVRDKRWRDTNPIVMGRNKSTDTAFNNTTFTKGLGVMARAVGNSDPNNLSYTVFDLADNNYAQSYFYSAAGLTNASALGGSKANGVVFEVWGSYDKTQEDYTQAEYVLLEKSGDPTYNTHVNQDYVYQFHLDVTGVRYLKLVVYAVVAINGMNSAWGGACVYNNPGYYPKGKLMGLNNDSNNSTWVPQGTSQFHTYHINDIPSGAVMLSGTNYKGTDGSLTSKIVDATVTSLNKSNLWLGGLTNEFVASSATTAAKQREGILVYSAEQLRLNAKNATTAGYLTFDISDLNVNRFYTMFGSGNQVTVHKKYDPGTTDSNGNAYAGIIGQVWGATTKDGTYTLLAESEPIMLDNVGEFDVDITGYKFLKLLVKTKDNSSHSGMDSLFYKPCVFNDQWTVAASGDDSVLQGMKADYTATVTRSFAPMHNYTGDFDWEIDGAEKEGTKIENGKLIVDPAETATSVSITATATEGNRTVTSAPLSVAIASTGDNVAYVEDNGFGTLGGALAAADGETVTLVKDVALTEAVAIDKAVTLDLNDKTVSGATIATLGAGADLTVKGGSLEGKLALAADGAKLTADCPIALELNGNDATVNAKNVTLTDSGTDDGTEGGKVYGNITLANAVTKEGNISYVAIPGEDANGKYYTANAVRVAVTKVNVRPSAAGIYYTTEFKFNKNVVDAGATYGVVLSLEAKPGADFMAGAKGEAWTVGAAPTAGENFASIGNSCLVKDIFKDTTPEENAARGAANIFANAYVKIGDTVVMAENPTDVVYSMQTVMEALNTKFGQLDDGTAEKVVNFYKDWTTAMATWRVANIAEAAK